jgi:hypothetical protein
MNIDDSIRRGYELFNRREWDRIARAFPADFEAIDRVPPDERRAHGPNALREITEANGDTAFADLRMEVAEVEVAAPPGERVIAAVRIHATASGGASGVGVESEIGQAWTFDAGVVTRMEQFRTWEEARAAAGLGA